MYSIRFLLLLSRAASRLKTADRESVSDEFLARVPQLQAVTAQLDNDLRQRRDAVTMIAAASAATKIIAEIVSLLV